MPSESNDSVKVPRPEALYILIFLGNVLQRAKRLDNRRNCCILHTFVYTSRFVNPPGRAKLVAVAVGE
ncbi:hypothetical protein LA080_009497 [Diaporthe eres]|nr:hypothetical protein LA080_009497 [Diaporthe eres]